VRKRILLATLLAVAVTACALGIPLGYTAVATVESLKRNDLDDSATSMAGTIDEWLTAGRPIVLSRLAPAVPPHGQVTMVTNETGRLTYGADPGPNPLSEHVPLAHNGTLWVSVPSSPIRSWQADASVFVVLLVLLSVGTGTVVTTITARKLVEPLRHVADRASRLGAGDFRPDPSRYGVAELDMVAESLDTSASALAQLVQRERDLVGDVSHQLRSRLTALQLRLETIAETTDQEIAEDASAALEQSERLAQVLDELLAAARAARAGGAEPIDLTVELPVIASEWRELLRADGRALRLRIQDATVARATPTRLREAIGVLLDNSLRHGTGPVTLTGRREEGTVVVEVSDLGPGVPNELAAHVFERGVSGGGSTGVGLALARALVDADGGRLELSVARPATFTIFLPVARAEDVLSTPWRAGVESSPR
jgi:signal transduction histidine kinase